MTIPGSQHDLAFDKAALKDLCRICGERAQSAAKKRANRTTKLCSDYRDEIQKFNGIEINTEETSRDLWPSQICDACYKLIINARRETMQSTEYHGVQQVAREV